MRKDFFQLEDKFLFAQQLIREAGQFIKKKMTEQVAITIKSQNDDLVTNVDQETQEFMIAKILQQYPEDHILAEEDEVRHPINDGNVWVIDPIDGTVNFVVQKNQFAVMVAYFEDGVGQFGCIYDVMNDLLLSGGVNLKVTLNQQEVAPYQSKPLDRALIGCNSGLFLTNEFGVTHLISHTLGVRVYGGAGISMLKVMTQELMAYFSHIQPWDYAAAMIIGKQLGYLVRTFDGQEPDFKTRQKVMFLPECELKHFENYLSE